MEDSFLQDLEPRKRPMGGDFPKGSKKVKSLCLQRSYADGKQTTWSWPAGPAEASPARAHLLDVVEAGEHADAPVVEDGAPVVFLLVL